MRPRTLAEVAALAAEGDSFDRCLANFLDEFYGAPNAAALAEAPRLLAPQFGDTGRVQDAYLAATAEELARRFDLPAAWVDFGGRTAAPSPVVRDVSGRGARRPPAGKPARVSLA
jgi:hypothetical protein